ncbi:MAG: exodeoxyribonuclease III [Candidatus Hinthialibacter antarcticus]|nr:exodeoxyribonuclease III [Candidatus Hinthialibacter antarcticus]
MEFMSWNVNGIRAAVRKGFLDFVAEADPDVLCLQEVRAEPDQVDLPLPQYHIYWNSAEKKGYSGVATLTKKKPINVTYDMGVEKHDHEGRVVTLEYKSYFLVNVYTPNSKRGLNRLEYRTQEWDVDFLAYVKKLEETKPVIFCGDLNVAHTAIDLANPRSNERNAGYTIEERRSFDAIVESGFVDTFREFTKEGGHYSWWSNFGRAREKNVGWRIDYFCISQALRKKLKEATILPEVQGSDHCPVRIVLK